MTASLDLNLLPFVRYAGKDYPELLGLYYSEPPRRSARGRNLDRLVFYLVFEGNAPLSPDKRDQMLADLARLYYHTAGSVTAALRKTAEELNRLLLERNHQLGVSRQGIGHFAQVVLREERITLAQSGSLHAFLIAEKDLSHFHDPELAGKGLGISRSAAVAYSQASIKPNDTLLLTAKPPHEWTSAALSAVFGQGPEGLRRHLFNQTSADLNAVALQAKQGKGKFYLLWSSSAQPAQPAAEVEEPGSENGAAAVDNTTHDKEKLPAAALSDVVETAQPIILPATLTSATLKSEPKSTQDHAPSQSHAPAVQQTMPAKQTIPADSFFTRLGASLAGASRKLAFASKAFISRMLPDETFMTIPSSVMALIAIAVPVVIVTAASVVYFRLGRSAQFELLSTQARQVAMQAMEQTDLGEKRADLGVALSLLQKADQYVGSSEDQAEIQTMRIQLRNALDELDFVKRVDYVPAVIGGLPPTADIISLTAFSDELYMLDKTSGKVLRAFLTDQGYEVDYTFQCGPGSFGEIAINQIVEIIGWPPGYKPEAKLVAVDSAGNILYCQPNQVPIAEKMLAPEADAWGNILQATLDQGDFYALDLPSNGVWIYWRANFGEQPTLFFDEDIPPLGDVIDMLVDRDDLYLLQSDGKMMFCVRETLIEAPTRCGIQSYVDRRPGRENLPLIPPVPFIQVLSTPPPDPSLYLLEPRSQAVYHFSLRNLAFQKQYLPEKPLSPIEATAFTINIDQRYIYLALGSQIFYAVMP